MEKESVLRDLFHGRIYPSEQIRVEESAYQEAVHRTSILSMEIQKSFVPSDLALFEKYQEADCEVQTLLQEETFIERCRLGMLIVLELLYERKL